MAEESLKIASIQNPRVTCEGSSVLLDVNDGDRLVFARLSTAATIKIGNKKCSLGPMIGCPFGSLFQVESGPKGPYLSRVVSTSEGAMLIFTVLFQFYWMSLKRLLCTKYSSKDFQWLQVTWCSNTQGKDNSQLKDELKDNRAIIDDNTAQSLSGEDIDAMRRQGAAGDEIVEALIANSSTFEKKTLFSQEKYRLRKQKKYAPRVLMRRPFARSICEAYFKKHPARIGFMRIDALSLLLSMANVGAYSDVLVVDMVGGILTGAVAERLGGTGYVCNTYLGDTPYSMDIVRIFNFSDEINRRIMRSPLSDLCSSKSKTSEHSKKENALSSVSTEQTDLPSGNGTTGTILTSMHETNSSLVDKPCKSTKPGERASPEVLESWKQNGFFSLIIAAPELDTWKAVQELLPLLSYSAPFAIYHQYLQPLATCMHKLQVTKMAIGLQISEPWLREYQVLPSRTHPSMQMSAFGGYILSGMRIYSG